jgi:hypothetical protein
VLSAHCLYYTADENECHGAAILVDTKNCHLDLQDLRRYLQSRFALEQSVMVNELRSLYKAGKLSRLIRTSNRWLSSLNKS